MKWYDDTSERIRVDSSLISSIMVGNLTKTLLMIDCDRVSIYEKTSKSRSMAGSLSS